MRKVEKEMASPTEDEIEISTAGLCTGIRILWDPSDPSYKNRNKNSLLFGALSPINHRGLNRRRGCVSANLQSVWLARPNGLAVYSTDRSDRRRLCEVSVAQVGEAVLKSGQYCSSNSA